MSQDNDDPAELDCEITVPQACRIVGRGYGWVYTRLLRGELEGRQVAGRFWVVDRKSAERLKEGSATAPLGGSR